MDIIKQVKIYKRAAKRIEDHMYDCISPSYDVQIDWDLKNNLQLEIWL